MQDIENPMVVDPPRPTRKRRFIVELEITERRCVDFLARDIDELIDMVRDHARELEYEDADGGARVSDWYIRDYEQ